ncbi:hypothetical protein ACFOHH_04405 [Shinella pollutisoli]|uniref:Uncharacterized protein n=2 Tax=Shinella pollutisoli TaxID=2250594 RepID=A0ABV7DBP0_9HYPH
MPLTLHTAKLIADHMLDRTTWVPPDELWLALHLGNPTNAGLFDSELSTADTGYARADITGKFSAADPLTGLSVLTDVVNIGPAEADWGTIRYVSVCNAQAGGTMLFYAILSEAETIYREGQFQRVPGQMQLRFI